MKQRHVTWPFGILAKKWRTFHVSHNVSWSVTENTAKTCCLLHNLSYKWDSSGCKDSLIVAILFSSQIPYGQLHFKFRKKSQYYSIPYPFGFIHQSSITMDAKRLLFKCPAWTHSFKIMGCYSRRHFSHSVQVVGPATVARPNGSCLVWNYSFKIKPGPHL